MEPTHCNRIATGEETIGDRKSSVALSYRPLAAGVALNLSCFSGGLGSYPQKTQNAAIFGLSFALRFDESKIGDESLQSLV